MNGYLLDENLPRRLCFQPALPVTHAETLGSSPTDEAVWAYARAHDLVIVSKDADFSDRMLISVPPPRVVHLRIGNMGRADFHRFLARVWPRIEALLPHHKLVNVYHDRVEAVA